MKCCRCPLYHYWSNESDRGESCAIFGDGWDKVIEPFLEERSCDEVWHTVRALRDFYDWVMNENAVKPCKDDLIKRSDVLETYADLYDIFDDNKEIQKEFDKVFDKLNSIPVVEPSEYADIAYGIGVCQGKASVEPCEDAVNREWLLDELEQMNVANFYELNIHSNEMYRQMKRMLRDAPSVAVEPKHGEWIISEVRFGNYKYQCKVCGWHEHHAYNDVKPYNFCPHCGAKMKGADE